MSIVYTAYRYNDRGGMCVRCLKPSPVLVDVGDTKLCEECIGAALDLFQQMREYPNTNTMESHHVPGKKD